MSTDMTNASIRELIIALTHVETAMRGERRPAANLVSDEPLEGFDPAALAIREHDIIAALRRHRAQLRAASAERVLTSSRHEVSPMK